MDAYCVVKFKNGGSGQSEQNCEGSFPSGLAPVEAGFCTTLALHFRLLPAGLVPVEARFADRRIADPWANPRSSRASPEGTIFSSACVVQKLAPHRHEAGGGNAIPQRQPPIQNWTNHWRSLHRQGRNRDGLLNSLNRDAEGSAESDRPFEFHLTGRPRPPAGTAKEASSQVRARRRSSLNSR